MRRIVLTICSLVVASWPVAAEAELRRVPTPAGEDLAVYDDVSGLAWMENMSESSPLANKDFATQLSAVAGMNAPGDEFHGLSGWHIATESELETLLVNPLRDIAVAFSLKWFGNTGVAMGRYENEASPSAVGRHNTFVVVHLACCEPYDMSPSGYGSFPYTQLEQPPGPHNDHLYYAYPVPSMGLAAEMQESDGVSRDYLSAWVVTANVTLAPDGTLAPKAPLAWSSLRFPPRPMRCTGRPWESGDLVLFTPDIRLSREHDGRIGQPTGGGEYAVGLTLKENRRYWPDPVIGRLRAFFRPTDVQPHQTTYRVLSPRDRAQGAPDPCVDCFWLVCTQECRIKGNAGKTNESNEKIYLVVDGSDNEDRATRKQLSGGRSRDVRLSCTP